jgi:SAM-dependent methyltransferase
MRGEAPFTEDLVQLAAETPDVARSLCGSCQNFHLLWPFLRLAGATGRAGDAAPFSNAALERAFSGARKILIAGAADTGLLAFVARAVGSHTGIVVLDRCRTPLETCRRFAARWSLPVETMHVDLMEYSPEMDFDIVLAHSLLQFIPADRRVDVLARLRRALRPGGRLALTFRTGGQIEGGLLPAYREAYPLRIIEKLREMRIALPEPREDFRRRLATYAEERREREGALSSPAAVELMIRSAGFDIQEMTPLEDNSSALFHRLTEQIGKRRFLAIARPER